MPGPKILAARHSYGRVAIAAGLALAAGAGIWWRPFDRKSSPQIVTKVEEMRLASEGSERSEIVPGGLKKDSLANHPGEETKRVIAEGAPFNLLLPDRDPLSTFSIAVDTGSEGVALPSTRLDAEGRTTVLKSLGKFEAGGSTNGGGGIKLAYELAMKEKNRGRSEPRAARHRR